MQYDKVSGKFVAANPRDHLFNLKNGSMLTRMEAEIEIFRSRTAISRGTNNKCGSVREGIKNIVTEESYKKVEDEFIKAGEIVIGKSPVKVQNKRAQ
jgi:hypothetical protein